MQAVFIYVENCACCLNKICNIFQYNYCMDKNEVSKNLQLIRLSFNITNRHFVTILTQTVPLKCQI